MNVASDPRGLGLAGLFLAFAAAPIAAQCEIHALPGAAVTGIEGTVYAVTRWDPDGAGPAAPLVIAGGQFTIAGGSLVSNLAAWDAATDSWSDFGGGATAPVRAFAVLPTNELVAAGDFTTIGGIGVDRIARYNGVTWAPLGSGLSGSVRSIAVAPNGDLVAGGTFSSTGDFATTLNQIARWNGSTWSPLGTGTNGSVFATCWLANGDVVAGGQFTTAGGVAALRIARWNGTAWAPLGPGITGGGFQGVTVAVNAAVTLANGDLVVGGNFVFAGGPIPTKPFLAQWDGTTWSSVGTNEVNGPVSALAVAANGTIVAGGDFSAVAVGGINTRALRIAQLQGTAWSPMANGFEGPVSALAFLPSGDLIAGGARVQTGDAVSALIGRSIARWDGAAWSAMGPGTDNAILAAVELPGGDLVVGGAFTTIGGVQRSRIARWDGATWQPIGTGLNGEVRRLLVRPDGSLVAAGPFTAAGGIPANGIALWDGTTWQALGLGLQEVTALCNMANGDLVAGGAFTFPYRNVARWTGSTWVALPGISPYAFPNNGVADLAVLPNGDLVASGLLTLTGPPLAVARWNGTSWTPLGNQPAAIGGAMHVAADGTLYAAITATTVTFESFDGTNWTTLAAVDGSIQSIASLPDGDLVLGGEMTTANGVNVARLARWDGTAMSPFGGGIQGPGGRLAQGPRQVLMTSAGQLVAVGNFTLADGLFSRSLARFTGTCPAVATDFGNGCNGSTGPVTLTADSLPWIGSTYRTTGRGFGPNSVALWLGGTTAVSVPLPLIHPAGLPGCLQLASFDVELGLDLPVAGVSTSTIRIPATTALVGLTFAKQVANVEFDASINITQISSSNGLSLTVGVF